MRAAQRQWRALQILRGPRLEASHETQGEAAQKGEAAVLQALQGIFRAWQKREGQAEHE